MREIKSELSDAKGKHDIAVLQNIPHHHGLVKANRFLLLLVSSLMVVIFVLGFLLLPANSVLDTFKDMDETATTAVYAIQNPVLSAEINTLKGQLVGLISGSIESKLRTLEQSVRNGSISASLGTIQDLKNDVSVLRSYSTPEKKEAPNLANETLLKEVSQLKSLIYLTLTSCGIMIAAIGGVWVRNRFRLGHQEEPIVRSQLGKHK